MLNNPSIIGREKEKDLLYNIYESGRSEFVAVYGRRRVGKTFLIKEMFEDEFAFYASGILEGDTSMQLRAFNLSLSKYGYKGKECRSWLDAFVALEQILREPRGKRSIVFIDELPCLDTFNSGLLPALDWFWNTFASSRKDIMFIVCGSATSWMLDKLLNNRQGLYNRLTRVIHLRPFKLREAELYAKRNNAFWRRIDILKLYCVIGGVPLYWTYLDYSNSVEENIDRLFFCDSPVLENEYNRLMYSIYKKPENYIKVINLLLAKKSGLTRNNIIKGSGLSGGYLSEILNDLEGCDFIRGFNTGKGKSNKLWQIIDPFILFYHQFSNKTDDSHNWEKNINTPKTNTWYGLSFERICMLHVDEILYSLHLDVIPTSWYSWRSKDSVPQVQIDLVIERSDNTISIAEIKFNALKEFTIDKEENTKILRRMGVFQEETKTRKGIQTVLITTFGISKNSYSGCIQRVVTLDDIFDARC